jgi:hypothetical protein
MSLKRFTEKLCTRCAIEAVIFFGEIFFIIERGELKHLLSRKNYQESYDPVVANDGLMNIKVTTASFITTLK